MPRIIPDTLPLCADTCPNLNVHRPKSDGEHAWDSHG